MGSFGALCKIPDLKIFIRLLLPQFSSDFNQNLACNQGKMGNTGYYSCYFFSDLPNFKSIWHFEEKLPQLRCYFP